MQEILKEVVVTFGDLLASLGYIVIGIISRRLWLVVLLALIWSAVAYAVHLQDQLGVSFQELPKAIDWEQVEADMPLRAGIALVISFMAWACMGLIIGSFRPTRRRRDARAARPEPEERETLTPRAGPAPVRAQGRGARLEPSLHAATEDDGIPPLPIGLQNRPGDAPPQPAPAAPPAQASSSFDVVLPRDPAAAAAALRRLYGEDELRRLMAELRPSREGRE